MIAEDRQSERLASWLDGRGAPDDVDTDVLEAVYAVRPWLAPAPKTSIEEILAHLDQADATARLVDGHDGDRIDDDVREAIFALRPELAPAPRTSIEEILAHLDQADATARLVDGSAADVDADVAEAVYALKPGTAPAAKVSIDDVLARVTTGPLAAAPVRDASAAARSGAEVIPFPARPAPAPPPIARKPANRRWGPVLAGSGAFGLFAVAAAAALLVLPNLPGGLPTPAPDAAAIAEPEAPRRAVEVLQSAPATIAEVPPPAGPVAADPVPAQIASKEATEAKPMPAPKAPAPIAAEAYDGDAVVDGLSDESDKAKDLYWAAPADDGASAGLFGGEALGTTGTGALGYVGDAPTEAEEAPAAEKKQRATRGGSVSNVAPAAPPPEPTPAKTTSTTSTKADAPAPGATAPGLRSADADTVARLAAIEADATALAGQGRYGDAARTLLPAIVPPREAGQYYAAMAAEWFLDARDVASAQDAVARGLALGTPVRAELARAQSAVERSATPATRPAASSPATTDH